MTEKRRLVVLNDEQWAVLGPLIDECRPRGKTEPVALRQTIEAIVWHHQNGAKWRSVPPDVPGWVVGDRGYASQAFRQFIWDQGARPAIPAKKNQAPVACPGWIYNNRVERLWARLKEWRAVATRYEKTAASFMGVLCLAAVFDWIRKDTKP